MFKYLNAQIKKLNWLDFKVAGIYGAFLGLLAGTIFPSWTTISFVWYLVPAVILAIFLGFRVLKK